MFLIDFLPPNISHDSTKIFHNYINKEHYIAYYDYCVIGRKRIEDELTNYLLVPIAHKDLRPQADFYDTLQFYS